MDRWGSLSYLSTLVDMFEKCHNKIISCQQQKPRQTQKSNFPVSVVFNLKSYSKTCINIHHSVTIAKVKEI